MTSPVFVHDAVFGVATLAAFQAALTYAGIPGPNTLATSQAAASFVDEYGNSVLPGSVVYDTDQATAMAADGTITMYRNATVGAQSGAWNPVPSPGVLYSETINLNGHSTPEPLFPSLQLSAHVDYRIDLSLMTYSSSAGAQTTVEVTPAPEHLPNNYDAFTMQAQSWYPGDGVWAATSLTAAYFEYNSGNSMTVDLTQPVMLRIQAQVRPAQDMPLTVMVSMTPDPYPVYGTADVWRVKPLPADGAV